MSTFFVFLKGILMGTFDVVPGVSGGTMAFITGIYERLLNALSHINMYALKLLSRRKIRTFRKYIDGGFLVALFAGILLAIAGLSSLIKGLLLSHPQFVRSFFGGLLLASSIVLSFSISTRTFKRLLFLFLGIIIGVVLISIPLMETQPTNFSTFLTGMIAIVAMILPGVSGSYLLLMMNHYYHILDIVHQFTQGATSLLQNGFDNTITIASQLPRGLLFLFIGGVVIGLLLFSKILQRLQHHYTHQLYALLTGMIVGSLPMLRPWKKTLEYYQDSHGNNIPLIQKNVLPHTVMDIWICLGLFLGGLAVVLFIYFLNKRLRKIPQKKP